MLGLLMQSRAVGIKYALIFIGARAHILNLILHTQPMPDRRRRVAIFGHEERPQISQISTQIKNRRHHGVGIHCIDLNRVQCIYGSLIFDSQLSFSKKRRDVVHRKRCWRENPDQLDCGHGYAFPRSEFPTHFGELTALLVFSIYRSLAILNPDSGRDRANRSDRLDPCRPIRTLHRWPANKRCDKRAHC